MEHEIARACAQGLSFFGKTNRLISHELKNVLAIISETLGLIDELIELSETGMGLEPGKLRSLSESVIEEVERANAIIRNMNTFAHSVDEIVGEVEVGQSVKLVMELCQLESAAKRTKLRFEKSEPCVLHTSRFFLENLIHHALVYALHGVGPENEIRVSLSSDEHGVRIGFAGIACNVIGEFPTKKGHLLARIVGAEVSMNPAAGELTIALPKKMDDAGIQNLISKD
ncbi:MAG: HAMP domain-containing histidine kinase [Deltaproteobacteria bacterium]|nr:HAMP domain-containing histidine kinase [Deltaproteobacteria bacterium]